MMNYKQPTPSTLAELQQQPEGTQIAALNQWCEDHYEEGADVMCECWDKEDFASFLAERGGDVAQAFSDLQSLASIYADQQADARYHRSQA